MAHFSAAKNGFFHAELHGQAMPADALEISDAQYAELMAAQAAGKVIQADRRGRPVAVDRPAPTHDELAAHVRRRVRKLLGDSAWSQAPDEAAQVQAAWRPYRQALRALLTAKDPAAVTWPTPPEA